MNAGPKNSILGLQILSVWGAIIIAHETLKKINAYSLNLN